MVAARSTRMPYLSNKDIAFALLQKRYTTATLPKQQKINHGEREMYYVADSNEAIIPQELFDRAKELRQRRSVGQAVTHGRLCVRMRCSCGSRIRTKQVNCIAPFDPYGKFAAKRKSHPTGTQFSAGWRYAFTGIFFYCLQQRKMQRFTRHRKLTHTGADGGADQHPDTRENARKAAKQLGRKTALKDLFFVSARPCILKENVLM